MVGQSRLGMIRAAGRKYKNDSKRQILVHALASTKNESRFKHTVSRLKGSICHQKSSSNGSILHYPHMVIKGK